MMVAVQGIAVKIELDSKKLTVVSPSSYQIKFQPECKQCEIKTINPMESRTNDVKFIFKNQTIRVQVPHYQKQLIISTREDCTLPMLPTSQVNLTLFWSFFGSVVVFCLIFAIYIVWELRKYKKKQKLILINQFRSTYYE